MAIEFKLPELGENIEGGDLVNVLVQEGEVIAAKQHVFEIETGKAVLPVPCPHAGRITKIHATAGENVKVGSVLLTLEAVGADASASTPAASTGGGKSASPNGDSDGRPTPTVAAASTAGAAVSSVASLSRATASAALPAAPRIIAEPEIVDDGPIPAGPAARRLARELGVDLRKLRGTGPRGRITPEDVTSAAGHPRTTPVSHAPATVVPTRSASVPAPVGRADTPGVTLPAGSTSAFDDRWGPIRREPLPQIRKAIAAQMVKSATVIPHVTNFDDVDITELERLRKGVKPGQFGANVKLTLLPFVMKSVALALKEHPLINSSLDEEHQQIVYKDYVHLGIAVDTPRGLVVPVLRDVDKRTIPELARSLSSIGERARASAFTLEDLKGGTFTLSNLGAVGGTYSTPIINHPEVAILLLGRSRTMPIFREGQWEPRLMLPLSISYDHRLIDGAEAARFLNKVIERLLSPAQLLLGE